MTMADTIAVMNAGEIEQMDGPAELYEHPRTTFVANFLGQSNLLPGTVKGSAGDELEVELEGGRVHADAGRSPVRSGGVWVGFRPEKVSLQRPDGVGENGSENRLAGGIVTDVSFVGVSTQYLVKVPTGQELMVFEQNTGGRPEFVVGDKADLIWSSDHTFLLDAKQDIRAGAELEDGE
jgi:spermidine/putrescine transport system ATP-binding protein